jgi:hypothetical protein
MDTAIDAPTFGGVVEDRVVDGFTSLLDEVDSEDIAARYDIGLHSNRIDFLEHVKIGLRLGIDDPNTLEDLAQQTDVYADLEPISRGHFSKLTTRRPFQAVAELATAILEHPSLYHPAGVARKRLEQLRERQVIGFDATRLPIRTTLVVDTGDDEIVVRPEDGGIELHMAARLDPAMKHPLTAFVTRANYPEVHAFPVLAGDIEVHEDLDSVIFVFDKGYVSYGRFAGMKNDGVDFITPLKDNAKHEVMDSLHDFVHEQPDGEEVRVTDEYIELGTMGREYRKVTIMHEEDDDEIYLTTLPPDEFDALEISLIYGVRWLIEIMFRELKQYMNVQRFHSTTLNGVLFELYCTFLAYILADYYRRQYPVRGGMPRTLRVIRNYWNRPLGEYG